jgi:hypothetical protein
MTPNVQIQTEQTKAAGNAAQAQRRERQAAYGDLVTRLSNASAELKAEMHSSDLNQAGAKVLVAAKLRLLARELRA